MKYYYIDKDGNKKKYIGNVIKRDGKLFGTLTKPVTTYEKTEVFPVGEQEQVKVLKYQKMWVDPKGKHHIYDEKIDGEIKEENGVKYIDKYLDTKIDLIYHNGED